MQPGYAYVPQNPGAQPAGQGMHHGGARAGRSAMWIMLGIIGLVFVGLALATLIVVSLQATENKKLATTLEGYFGLSSPVAPPTSAPVTCTWCRSLESRRAAVGPPGCTPLYQRDFANGTYIMDTDMRCYFLAEDIVFDPAPALDYRASMPPYANDAAFVLDFFAAILVRADHIAIDLNDHWLNQSQVHALEQTFFALIELNTPFIASQGPADFVGTRVARTLINITVHNGKLGLNSHHGIHGNDIDGGFFEDLIIVDYEIAGISLNAAKNTLIRRVHVQHNRRDVPVLGTYSAARFMIPFAQRALAQAQAEPLTPAEQYVELNQALTDLQALMSNVRADVQATGFIDESTHAAAFSLFDNALRLPDGSAAYGILLHARGAAVNGFQCDRSGEQNTHSYYITVVDCTIEGVATNVIEVPALQEVNSSLIVRGPAGDLFRIASHTQNGTYVASPLSRLACALQEMHNVLNSPPPAGTLYIPDEILQWTKGTASLANAVQEGRFTYLRNGDTMFHVNKGAFGIRVGGGHHVAVKRTVIREITNVGAPGNMHPLAGETWEDAFWMNANDGGHPGQAPQSGYGGADSRGLVLAATSNVLLESVTVQGVFSYAGWSDGLLVFNDAAYTTITDVTLRDITSYLTPVPATISDAVTNAVLPRFVLSLSNKMPRAAGISVSTDAMAPTFKGSAVIEGVEAGRLGVASNYIVENAAIDKCASSDINFYA